MNTPPSTTDSPRRAVDVVSVRTDEVEVTVGPRRITGLVTNTAQHEDEARAARVYGHHTARVVSVDTAEVDAVEVDAAIGSRRRPGLIFNAPAGQDRS